MSSSYSDLSGSEELGLCIFENPHKCGLLTVNKKKFAIECDVELTQQQIKIPKSKKRKPSATKIKTVMENEKTEKPQEFVSICMHHSRYDVVAKVAAEFKWKKVTENETWNIFWTDTILGAEFCRSMRRFQKMNHFPGMFEICRKDLLARNMNRMLKLFPNEYNIFPKTWHLPADLGDATRYMQYHKNRTLILKPDHGAQGRGIYLTRTLKNMPANEHMICQLYINRPLLIDDFKFDLRVYALITCVDPLRLYVYNEGLARFATSPYSMPKGHNTTNMYMHLTNYSVNKHSRTYSKDDEYGSKRKFSTLNRLLSAKGYDVVTLWNNIDDVVVKTVISAWPVLKHNYHASFPSHDITQACFEILGVDIIIDRTMKPWLLEVNHSPSFHMDGQVDKEVKLPLIRDTFRMLNVKPSDKKRVLEADKRRINNRLLRSIKEARNVNDEDGLSMGDFQRNRKSPWQQQIEWEETNMGNFRRVLPTPGDPLKYSKFFSEQCQTSLLSDTIASKRREEAAQLQRQNIENKEKFAIPLKESQVIEKLANRKSKKGTKIGYRSIGSGFFMEAISETEERERLALMAQRDFIVKSCNVLQSIYVGFYQNNLLTGSDLTNYERLNRDVDSQFEIIHYERPLRVKNLQNGCVSTCV